MAFDLSYEPDGSVLKSLLKSRKFFRGVRGPVGSGKSVACAWAIMLHALQQEPGPDGIRRSRWGVVRNTNPQLKTTTIKTWLDWFPEEVFGNFNWSPPYTHNLRFGDVDLEVIFLALDTDKDVRKLLSLEFTGIWINEAREIPKAVLDGCTQRVGRYPSMKHGGPSWYGVIADTNSPDPEHWWAIMSGECPAPEWMSAAELATLRQPEGWEFFCQPPGMVPVRGDDGVVTSYALNPDRENAKNLSTDYYERIITGKAQSWINVYVLNKYDTLFTGRPVYDSFNRNTHVSKERLQPINGQPVYVGIDFGLTPAAIFAQRLRGRWLVQRELVMKDMGTLRFSREFKAFVQREYPGFNMNEFVITGDPAGDQRAQTDEATPFQILRANGIHARPANTNDIEIRIDAVHEPMNRMIDGMPGYLLSNCCTELIKGKEGGYHYKEGSDRPEKNASSHPADAEQYCFLGGGEGRAIIGSKAQPAFTAGTRFNPFQRRGAGSTAPSFRPRAR